MLNKEIKEKILKIIELGLEVNSREKNTVFVNYSGHCDVLELRIHSEGWKQGKGANFFRDVYLATLSQREAEQNLDGIIKELEELKIN
ncbi:hypothetical protein [Fusobacterium polymorphum]|uniref:hypothetical protein n=1 Tax=Fusobacterium nucleatum subsp. polymorphum TaxID=76857 RepID=UPI00300B92AE